MKTFIQMLVLTLILSAAANAGATYFSDFEPGAPPAATDENIQAPSFDEDMPCQCETPIWFTPFLKLSDGTTTVWDRITQNCPAVNDACSNHTCVIYTGGGRGPFFGRCAATP